MEKREYQKKVGEHFEKSIADSLKTADEASYEADLLALHKAVSDYFDNRETDARRDVNKNLVDQIKIKTDRKNFVDNGELPSPIPLEIKNKKQAVLIAKERVRKGKAQADRLKAERTAFDETGELPDHIPMDIVQTARGTLAKLRAAFDLAMKDYAKSRKADEASWAENELKNADEEWGKFLAFIERIDLEAAIVAGRERVIATGLDWLARKQLQDGSWAFDGKSTDKVAATGMALLPFLWTGEWHKPEGKYKKTVENGLDWLTKRLGDGGGFPNTNNMYAHALATLALCEATRMTKDPALKAKATRAVGYTVGAQGRNGSWGYSGPAPSEGDTSILGWQIQTLVSAKRAEIEFDDEKVFKNANKFLESVSTDSGSKYGYTTKGASQTLTPVGLLSRYMMGTIDPNGQAFARGVEFLKQFPPQKGYFDTYYYYYATQVVHVYEGPDWHKSWKPKMRDLLIDLQNKGADENRGSWEKDQGFIGSQCGKLGTTALTIRTLQVCGSADSKKPEANK